MSPMSRFALFTACLVVVAAIGYSQPRHGASVSKSLNDMCVCVPARAALLMKKVVAKTHGRSAELAAVNTTSGR
jgi:hypothetical protein